MLTFCRYFLLDFPIVRVIFKIYVFLRKCPKLVSTIRVDIRNPKIPFEKREPISGQTWDIGP